MSKLHLKSAFLIFLSGSITSCGISEATYTLYRDSPSDSNMRIHVATFDADQSDSYNRENCEAARMLFQNQTGVTAKYWCEKGKYR